MSTGHSSDRRALLFHASVAADLLDDLLAAALASGRLSAREFEVATVLATRGPATPGEISVATGVPAPSVSRVLAHLAELGFVGDARNPADARSRIVDLTHDGRAAFAEAQELFGSLYDKIAELLGASLPVVDGSVRRLEWALRTLADVPIPDPLTSGAGDVQQLAYAGQRLGLAQEAEVVEYITWVRARDARSSPR